MIEKKSPSRKAFLIALTVFFVLLCLMCLLPFLNVFALSFSHKTAVMKGEVMFLPKDFNPETREINVGFNLMSYEFLVRKKEFLTSFGVSVQRVLLGTLVNMALCVFTAYPLSKSNKDFRARTVLAWVFIITILFSGGLVPWYIIIGRLNMLNTLWALIIPNGVNVFNVLLMMNFFRGLPKAIEESAYIDGAGHIRMLFQMFLPLSLPSLATVTLFTVVGHWNAWFDGMILMTSPEKYPLQSYMQTLVASTSTSIFSRAGAELLKNISDRTVKSAQVFLGMIPMLLLYPFMQRYFISGIVLGSVKE